MLTPIAQLAERHGCAVLASRTVESPRPPMATPTRRCLAAAHSLASARAYGTWDATRTTGAAACSCLEEQFSRRGSRAGIHDCGRAAARRLAARTSRDDRRRRTSRREGDPRPRGGLAYRRQLAAERACPRSAAGTRADRRVVSWPRRLREDTPPSQGVYQCDSLPRRSAWLVVVATRRPRWPQPLGRKRDGHPWPSVTTRGIPDVFEARNPRWPKNNNWPCGHDDGQSGARRMLMAPAARVARATGRPHAACGVDRSDSSTLLITNIKSGRRNCVNCGRTPNWQPHGLGGLKPQHADS